MKKIFVILIITFIAFHAQSQQYNNEWIDYNKTYYKFKIGATGLYRINQPNLPAALQSVDAAQFQLSRNGKEVAIYTSVTTGILPSNGYIEFWGEQNDGKPDRALYKDPANQLSDALSLETDTAAYFLTVNSTGNNLRIRDTLNDVANNTLSPELYFMYDYRVDFKDMINRGLAANFGEYVYSSTYDVGEWWSSRDISPSTPLIVNAGDLKAANATVPVQLNVSVVGNSFIGGTTDRTVKIDINGSIVISQILPYLNAQILSNDSVSLSLISTNTTNFTISEINNSVNGANDRFVTGFLDLNYPRKFDFGSSNNFVFNMPASAAKYLEISNFSWGTATPPVLYDLSNNKRYIANTSVAGLLRFALLPSNVDRKLVLVSEDSSNIKPINSLTQRNFINFTTSSNQGDYLIISNKILIGTSTTGPVQKYRDYRGSLEGGSFTAKIYDIDDLVDEFAYGIKMHPLSIKNFLSYARNTFAVKPKFAFLIGKAVTYNDYRANEKSPYADKLNLVPTFGWPASDNLLASADLSPLPATNIGRLAAITQNEVQIYLDKVTAYEQQQASTLQTIANKAWMKTVVHVVGANDQQLYESLTRDMNMYKTIIIDTLFGGSVTTFSNATSNSAGTASNDLMTQIWNNGISLINYFGHSAATTLDYNLNEPTAFNNYQKYPVFIVGGCNAGNIYSYDTSRLNQITSLSEKYVLTKDKGSIAFIASTHFGVESYLHTYNLGFYRSLDLNDYNTPVSNNMNAGVVSLLNLGSTNFTATLHAEENVLHGDPAIKVNAHAKPDFVIEEPQVIINPSFISVADNSFNIKCYFYNIGKATGDSVSVLIKRQYPDGSISILASQKIKSVRYIDSLSFTIPIVASTDKGENKLTVTIDDDYQYMELSEMNNSVTKSFFIYEDELNPVYPYNFSIVSKNGIKFYASTANPVTPSRQYVMELDTTELFNSSLKAMQTITSVGGVLEFTPSVSFTDSTVYYWRVAPVPTSGPYHWNTFSFVYIPGSSAGFNQSHLYQHLKSNTERIYIDSFSRRWTYKDILSSLSLYNGIFNYSGFIDADFQVQINGNTITEGACLGHSIIFNLFDPVTLKPYYNQTNPSTVGSGNYGGFMDSWTNAGCTKKGNEYNFEFHYWDTSSRRKMRDFMDWIPNGLLVTMRLIYDEPYDQSASLWHSDTAVYGAGNTFYDRLVQNGFTAIDSFNYFRTWVFNYEKNNPLFTPEWKFSNSQFDLIIYNRDISSSDTLGYITSPLFGPAKAWKKVLWNGYSVDSKPGDKATVDVIGIDSAGGERVLYTLNTSQQNFDISTVSVASYPYLKLKMRNADSINLTPYQLRWWRILYDAVPEGALAPNILYTFSDTVALGQSEDFSMAFKNVSETAFADSILVKLIVYDAANNTNIIPVAKLKKLNPGDTAVIKASIDTKLLGGLNNLYLDVNPENAQPEQYHFNNFLYKTFTVAADNYKPTLDVTFDGVHILNNDIVSAQPHIVIKMKDESGYLLLDDTSLFTVQLQYPDGSMHPYYFNTDTLTFTPATKGTDNTATVDFTPYLTTDGNYQLLVHGKDKTGNPAGNADYKVSFQVYNKPMITNMFNYPNPFTTSTAFVFTVTGSEVPQNIRIQILTITGKIVKEITKAELGDLHIGRNITDYKWDGTDQYGQKLANGVYLYRVLTNLNRKSLDKFPTYDKNGFTVDTDKYFTKGYGKMYLMR